MGLHVSHVDAMPRDEGDELIRELTAFATQPQFCYRHHWQVGDLVMWDNRCTLHRAMPYELEGERRLLHRTTIAGDGPLV
jgi:alpha-ketoglutarate-dependent taurine dioxygenase